MAQNIIFNMTFPAVLAMPQLIVAHAYSQPGKAPGKPKFEATFLFKPDHPDVPALSAALEQAGRQLFPGGVPSPFKYPFEDGALRAQRQAAKQKDGSHFNGYYVLTSRTGEDKPPGLSVMVNGVMRDLHGEERISLTPRYFYGGVMAIGTFNLSPYDGGGGVPGVTAYLQVVSSMNYGDRNPRLEMGMKSGVAAHGAAAQAYAAHIGHVSHVNPTAGLPGAVPNLGSFV